MPLPRAIWFPEIQLTMIRRATARLPRNNFVFRTATKWTKPEIKQFLEAAYGVRVVRVATVVYGPRFSSVGRIIRTRRGFKKVYVSIADDSVPVTAPDYDATPIETEAAAAAAATERA